MISKVRTNYLRTVSPSLSIRTFQYLRGSVGFGDWLLLIMMSHNLDVKLFTDILVEIGRLILSYLEQNMINLLTDQMFFRYVDVFL